jgi:hypothetical protein
MAKVKYLSLIRRLKNGVPICFTLFYEAAGLFVAIWFLHEILGGLEFTGGIVGLGYSFTNEAAPYNNNLCSMHSKYLTGILFIR